MCFVLESLNFYQISRDVCYYSEVMTVHHVAGCDDFLRILISSSADFGKVFGITVFLAPPISINL